MPKPKLFKHVLLDISCIALEVIPNVRLVSDNPPAVLSNWPPGEPFLTRVVACSVSNLWRKMQLAGVPHFANMPAEPWVNDILEAARKVADKLTIVAGSPYFASAKKGRAEWVKKHCGDGTYFQSIQEKQRLASRDVLLIDTSDLACEVFVTAGGRAILWPSHMNSLHAASGNPLAHVLACLKGEATVV